ncbi:MAG: sigma-70 family RNA polymerase sigma factor [Clostridia bacterium]|nr:sigma-70 family RNA polymerase sigma factor [Clostridia bacterium]
MKYAAARKYFSVFQQFFPLAPSNRVKGVGTVLQGNQLDGRSELDRLMEQYGSSLLRMSALYLKDADLAQDAVQETFIKAFRHLNDYRGESSEKTWLTTICVNTCRDMLRTAWFRHQSRIDLDSLPERPADFEFPDNTVLTAVMRLPAKYREVVLLRYYEGLKLKEVAGALRLSEGKVRSRLNKANDLLRDRLKEWYYEES